nr:uncharacterized protein LOC129380072 [Dermacentor andersoni]
MTVVRALAAVFLMAAYVGGIPYDTAGCDVSGIDLEGAVDKILGKLPRYYAPYPGGSQIPFAGLDTGALNVTGLDQTRRFGPLRPYCVNGFRLMIADFVNEGDAVLSMPWKACFGEGTLNLRAEFTRFTLVFRVITGGPFNNKVGVVYEGPIIPVIYSGPHIYIDGAGQEIRDASIIVSRLLPGITGRMWDDYFFRHFHGALLQAAREVSFV